MTRAHTLRIVRRLSITTAAACRFPCRPAPHAGRVQAGFLLLTGVTLEPRLPLDATFHCDRYRSDGELNRLIAEYDEIQSKWNTERTLHVRDPRSVTLSWSHHICKYLSSEYKKQN